VIEVTGPWGSKSYSLATDYQIDRHGLYLLDEDDKEVARIHPDAWRDVINVDLAGDVTEVHHHDVGIHFPTRIGE
jgi:hypothetical protein